MSNPKRPELKLEENISETFKNFELRFNMNLAALRWPDILIITLVVAQVIIKVLDHHYRCLAGDYDLEIGHF